MIFWIADDRDLSAVGSYHVTFGYGVGGVVRALGMNIGLECQQELFDGWFVEDRDVGHRLKCRHDFCTFTCWQHRSAGAFLKQQLARRS